jgi:hypothetical protein
MPQIQRIQALNTAAIVQMQSLLGMNSAKAFASNLQIEAQSGKAIISGKNTKRLSKTNKTN